MLTVLDGSHGHGRPFHRIQRFAIGLCRYWNFVIFQIISPPLKNFLGLQLNFNLKRRQDCVCEETFGAVKAWPDQTRPFSRTMMIGSELSPVTPWPAHVCTIHRGAPADSTCEAINVSLLLFLFPAYGCSSWIQKVTRGGGE